MSEPAQASIVAVHRSRRHEFSKQTEDEVVLVEGIGVEGDSHAGVTVQHRSRARFTPQALNLRQVHLMHAELFDQVVADGFEVRPGDLGENITTRGIDLLGLPVGTLLRLGDEAVVELTGLRNPCVQIDRFQAELMKRLVFTGEDGQVVRLAGVMSIVRVGGTVRAGDAISVQLPAGEKVALAPV